MKYILLCLLFSILSMAQAIGQDTDDEAILTDLLHEFMQGASQNDAEVHDRFWAEDLIYTSSSGERIRKQDIMDGLASETGNENSSNPVYSAEDIEIQLYGDAAVVAFRLVARFGEDEYVDTMNFLNTGTFLKRDRKWKAVAWQATRMHD